MHLHYETNIPRPLVVVLTLTLAALTGCAEPHGTPGLMTYEAYDRLEHPVPYVLLADQGPGALLYYGSRHVYDPADPQVADLQRRWASFRPTLAFNEGGDPPAEREVAAAMQYGEAGLVRYLARRDNVPVRSLDPPLADQIDSARSAGYEPESVKLFFVLRYYVSYRRAEHPQSPDAFIARVLRDPAWAGRLAGPPCDLKELASSYDSLFPQQTDWHAVPDAFFDPVSTTTILNRISRTVSQHRDRFIMRLLAEAVQRGERVFAVVGASHVVMQEAALAHELRGLRQIETASPAGRTTRTPSPGGSTEPVQKK